MSGSNKLEDIVHQHFEQLCKDKDLKGLKDLFSDNRILDILSPKSKQRYALSPENLDDPSRPKKRQTQLEAFQWLRNQTIAGIKANKVVFLAGPNKNVSEIYQEKLRKAELFCYNNTKFFPTDNDKSKIDKILNSKKVFPTFGDIYKEVPKILYNNHKRQPRLSIVDLDFNGTINGEQECLTKIPELFSNNLYTEHLGLFLTISVRVLGGKDYTKEQLYKLKEKLQNIPGWKLNDSTFSKEYCDTTSMIQTGYLMKKVG